MSALLWGGSLLKVVPSRVRHQIRKVLRAGRFAFNPGLYPVCRPVRAYWWTWHPNFGDELTGVVLPLVGMAPEHRPERDADFFGVGSVIELIPPEFTGWVWGTGKLHADVPTSLPDARFLAVRGELTRDLLDLPVDTPLGDPGILVSRVLRPASRRRGVAVVPHFSHRDLPEIRELKGRLGSEAFDVDVTKDPRSVIRRIRGAQFVVTTSLHGLIVADAYSIPAVWALPEPVLGGGDFKFRDYESGVLHADGGRRVDLVALRSVDDLRDAAYAVDPDRVATVQQRLLDAIRPLAEDEARRVSPLRLLLASFDGRAEV